METLRRVPYDLELQAGLSTFLHGLKPQRVAPETIAATRRRLDAATPDAEELVAGRPVTARELTVPGPAGAPDVPLLVLSPAGGAVAAPAVYHMHGGGMVFGNRYTDTAGLVDWVAEFGLVVVSVGYRLAPENPYPAAVEDCYAGLTWLAAHAEELGVDPGRILAMGSSAGGGLGAAMALLCRDRGGPALAGQALICPMIDDRNDTVSARQYDGIGAWDRDNNLTGWTALLGPEVGGEHVSAYAAPARAADLAGLPPALVEVGSAEVFRDEDVRYAERLLAAGTQVEVHVWSGAFHGFTSVIPFAPVSKAALASRRSWLVRTLRL